MHKDLTLNQKYYQFLKSLIHFRNTLVTKIKQKIQFCTDDHILITKIKLRMPAFLQFCTRTSSLSL